MKLLSICCFMLAATKLLNAQEQPAYKKVSYPEGYTEQLNIVYTKVGDWDGRMDLYLPPKEKGPSPVVINIHGGGWNHGVKESQSGFGSFFKRGYAVANIEYRLTPQATAPAAVEDTRCALIYLIKNAKVLNIDPDKIVIMGGSAGGHLALMGGLLANDSRFDNNCAGEKNIKVAAIIDKYGIADVGDWAYGKHTSKSAMNWLGDKAQDLNFRNSVSPIYHVNKNSPPVFIVHGNADPVVPYQQSVDLHKKLDEMGVKNVFMTIDGGKHGGFENEDKSLLSKRIQEFLIEIGL